MPLNPSDQGTYDKIKRNLIDTVDPFDIMPSLVDVFTRQDRQMLTQTTKDLGSRFGMMDLLDKYENKAKNSHPLINALKQANYSIECFFNDEPASGSEQTSNVEAGSLTVSELKEQIKFMQEEMKGMQTELGHMKSAKDGEKAQKEIKQLRKDLKNMELKLEQQQMKENTNYEGAMARHSTSEDNPSSSFNYETTSTTKIENTSCAGAVAGEPASVDEPTSLETFVYDYVEPSSTTKIGDFHFPPKSILLVGGGDDYNYRDMELYATEDPSKSCELPINSRIPRRCHAGEKIDSKIIIYGGNCLENNLSSTELFDVRTGQWTDDGPDMTEIRFLAMSAAIRDTLFVFGGQSITMFGFNSFLTGAEKYQISGNPAHWQAIADLPTGFFSGNAVTVGEHIYIMGINTFLWLFPLNMSTLTFVPAYDEYRTTIPVLEEKKHGFASTLLYNNTIVVTGGLNYDDSRVLNSCQMLDIRDKNWEPLSDMNIGRCDHQLVNIDDKLYAIGGRGGHNDECLSSVEMFDLRNKKWMNEQPLKYERCSFTAFAM